MEQSDVSSEKLFNRRFSVGQLMAQTAIASLFFAALLHENVWWRAILGTVTIGMIFNEIVAVIYATDRRRAYAIGHSLAALLFPISLYGAAFTLPYLITIELLKLIETIQTIDETNFTIVMGMFWLHVSCRCSGYLGMYWNRRAKLEQAAAISAPTLKA